MKKSVSGNGSKTSRPVSREAYKTGSSKGVVRRGAAGGKKK